MHNANCADEILSKLDVDKFTIKSKHLNSTGSDWSKFNVGTEAEAKIIVKDALKRDCIKSFGNNFNRLGSLGQKSFNVLLDAGKIIGTKGQKGVYIIFDELQNIWTIFPK